MSFHVYVYLIISIHFIALVVVLVDFRMPIWFAVTEHMIVALQSANLPLLIMNLFFIFGAACTGNTSNIL